MFLSQSTCSHSKLNGVISQNRHFRSLKRLHSLAVPAILIHWQLEDDGSTTRPITSSWSASNNGPAIHYNCYGLAWTAYLLFSYSFTWAQTWTFQILLQDSLAYWLLTKTLECSGLAYQLSSPVFRNILPLYYINPILSTSEPYAHFTVQYSLVWILFPEGFSAELSIDRSPLIVDLAHIKEAS